MATILNKNKGVPFLFFSSLQLRSHFCDDVINRSFRAQVCGKMGLEWMKVAARGTHALGLPKTIIQPRSTLPHRYLSARQSWRPLHCRAVASLTSFTTVPKLRKLHKCEAFGRPSNVFIALNMIKTPFSLALSLRSLCAQPGRIG